MAHTILIDVSAGMLRAALTDAKGRLCELCVEPPKKEPDHDYVVAGAIYKARVTAVNPSLNMAFVDLGVGPSAVLHGYNVPASLSKTKTPQPLAGVLRENSEIMVEVKRPGYASKGPKVSADIALGGRYMILLPYTSKTFTSQKLPPGVRKRLEAESKNLSPRGKILRTSAAKASFETLAAEECALINRWREIEALAAKTPAPCALYTPDIIWQALESWLSRFEIEKIICNHNSFVQKIKTLYPQLQFNIKLHTPAWNLFSGYNLETQIEQALNRRVTLPSGVSLVIEATESMTVIDVNSSGCGGANFEDTALKVNLAAAREIARELILRCIGGLVVIDFIDMHSAENRARVAAALRTAMFGDANKVEIDGFTKTGLLTLKRSRGQRPWQTFFTENCGCCQTGQTLNARYFAHKIYREILDLEPVKNAGIITLKVHADIADFFEKAGQPLIVEMQNILQTTVCIEVQKNIAKSFYQILQTSPNI